MGVPQQPMKLLLAIVTLWICYADSFRDQQYALHGHTNARCVDIPQNLSLCHSIGYTRMRLPNLLDQETLDEVSQQSIFWLPLLASRCNSNTRLFLCSLFSPVCLDQPVYPCRSLCESVRDDCEPRMAKYGFPWPGMFACDQFPVDNQLCIGQINMDDEVTKGTEETIEDITKVGSFGFKEVNVKPSKPNFHYKTLKKAQNRNRNKQKGPHIVKEDSRKNDTKEPLRKDEVIRTLELICWADFAARIKPTGIYSLDASGESRITSKKVVFYKTDDAVLRTAKTHPSDFGPTHYHRYYFYTDDALLIKLSQKNLHPSFKDDPPSNQTTENNTWLASIPKSHGGITNHDLNHRYKIHKNDQLLVAGNKTTINGKHSRLTLMLIMHIDEESQFVKKIIKMFKESSDFCREAVALKDPIIGEKRLKNFISPMERKPKDNSSNHGHNKGTKKGLHKDRNIKKNRKNKFNSDEYHNRQDKNSGDYLKHKLITLMSNSKIQLQTEAMPARRFHKVSGKTPIKSGIRNADEK